MKFCGQQGLQSGSSILVFFPCLIPFQNLVHWKLGWLFLDTARFDSHPSPVHQSSLLTWCYWLDVERGAQEVGTSRTLWGLCVGHLRHDNLIPEVVTHQWRMTTTALVHQSKCHLRHTQQSALYFSHKDMLIEWVNNCWLGWQNRTVLGKCTHLYNEMQEQLNTFNRKSSSGISR